MFKVLLVEDNVDFRHSLNKSLMLCFPAMVIAESSDGRDAMIKIDYFKPDLVFMDIKLPDENGLNLTKNIKAEHSDIAVIVMTANDAPEYYRAAYQAGATYFIDKGSVSMEKIPAIVEAILGSKVCH